MKKTPKRGALDRFGTHKHIVDNMSAIVAESGASAFGLLCWLWDRAIRKLDGRTACNVTVSALARGTGLDRKTIRAGLRYLVAEGWVTHVPAVPGKPKSEHYVVWHKRYGEGDPEDTERVNSGE